MAYILNEEQELLRDSAKDFLAGLSPVGALRALRDSDEEWSEALWKEMAEMGWPGIVIAEQYGGLEFGYIGAGLLAEECGRTLASSPFVSSALVCSSLVAGLGSEEQKLELLPAIASGELILTLAAGESRGAGAEHAALTARPDGDGFLLDGSKAFVVDGNIAHKFLVVARASGEAGDTDGLEVFLVDREAEGLEIAGQANADNHRMANLSFRAVRVGAGDRLPQSGRAWEEVQKALDIGAVSVSAEMLGIAEESFTRTVEYLKERKQFGVPVGSFQALQFRCAELFSELQLCRSAVLAALDAIDQDREDRSLLASLAKAKCGKTARLAVNEAVQMHGGIGMTDEFDIGFFMKRAASARQEYGDCYYHTDRFARLRGY
jgi:alkylation response protein AidB-like acyl-CoA dehydrogenase